MKNISQLKKDFQKYILLICFALAALLAYLVVRPYLIVILTSIIIAYIFYPVYLWLYRKVKVKNIAALIVLLIVIIIVAVPVFVIANALIREVTSLYVSYRQSIAEGALLETGEVSILDTINIYLSGILSEAYIARSVENFSSAIISKVSGFVMSVPKMLFNFFIVLFLVFFMLKDGQQALLKLKDYLPLKKNYNEKISHKLSSTTRAIIFGHFLTAVIQGICATIGFYIFGVTSPLFWGLVTTVACMIPFVGAPVVWIPLGLVRIITGIAASHTPDIFIGIGILIYGAVVISTIDDIVKPKIIGSQAKVHPAVILIGVLGGISLFGVIGIVAGPLVLSVFAAFAEIYKMETE